MGNGAADYLVKPVEPEKLKAAVAKAMEQRQLLGRMQQDPLASFCCCNFRRIHHYGDDVGALYEVGSSIFSSAG